MNKLLIPPPPNWYETNVLACAPDNTVIYASRQDVVIISAKSSNEPADINVIRPCHEKIIVGVVVCPKWGEPDKLVATIGDDMVVRLLDITTKQPKRAHTVHRTRQDKLVGVTFAGQDQIISVSEDGFIVIWQWIKNKLNSLSNLIVSKSKVTCVSSCPHATWLTAFGFKRGDILVTDLRKTGRILHRLLGNDPSIICLSWCPTPYNVFSKEITRQFLIKAEQVKEDEHCDNDTDDVNQDASESINSIDDDANNSNDAKNICAEDQEIKENSITVYEKVVTDNIAGSENVVTDSQLQLQNKPETNEPVKEYLLATSSRGGRVINIWRAGSDGVNQIQLMLPTTYQSGDKSWISLCWVTPKRILSSSPKGELLQWNLAEPERYYKPLVIHGDHQKHIFCIAAPIRLQESSEDENCREKSLVNAWTVGKDRLIKNTSLCSKREPLASYQTFTGSIYCLVPCIDYPSKIAIGASESCRLWDLSLAHRQNIVMTNFSEKMQHKIVSLAWHPQKDTILAYGTMNGQVGFLDPCNTSKASRYCIKYANAPVHRLEWGPFNGNLQDFRLYAVVNGKLTVYDYNQRLEAPIVFHIDEVVTQMAWNTDYSVCAVAGKAGHILLYSSEMKLLTTLYFQNNSVKWITWHPIATSEDEGISPYVNWLAVATNDVTVYDCSINDDLNSDYSNRVVAVFKDHTKIVECLSWSTFEGGKLASCGDDGTAMVWDVKTKTLLHTCVVANDILITVLWSPTDPDYILTGSKSGVLQIWKLSEHPPRDKHDGKRPAHKLIELKEEKAKEIRRCNKHKKYVLPGTVEALNKSSIKDCRRMFDVRYGQSNNTTDTKSNQPFDFLFGSDINLLVDFERKFESKKRVSGASSHINIWQGTTDTAIRDAINRKSLNPWLISMAPTVSHDLYLEACESYADNIVEGKVGDIYEAVAYYLTCHQLPKAIELLCKTNNYVEALMLAKCRLISTDLLITNILERWAAESVQTGELEIAAQCYMALNQPGQAARVLFERTDLESLKLCTELAKLGDDKHFLDEVLMKVSALEEE